MKKRNQNNVFLNRALNVMFILFLIIFVFSISASVPKEALDQKELLQFRSGGHIMGFHPKKVYLASLSHALSIEFLGTRGVMPKGEAEEGSNGRGAPPLRRVTYAHLWPGISAKYEAERGVVVKSTYRVDAGAHVSSIELCYNVPIEVGGDGSLRYSFKNGYMSESAPAAWQEIGGKKVPVSVRFKVTGGNRVGFSVSGYDSGYPLVVDHSYQWHTFYGSYDYDDSIGIALDISGNVYIAGHSYVGWQGRSGENPLHNHNGVVGKSNIVVLKLNSSGAYQWHTFYGSQPFYFPDFAGIALDAAGNVYVTGGSDATWQGPSGENPLHKYSGGFGDIVVLKLTSVMLQ